MNIYRHLFFIIPIFVLLLWGYVGSLKVNPWHWVYYTVVVSTILGVAGATLYIGRMLIPLMINFYSYIGKY